MWRWLQPQFLFNSNPTGWGTWHGWAALVLFGVLLLGSWFSWWQSKRAGDRQGLKWWRWGAIWGLWSGGVGVVLWFFAWQRIPLLAMRLWLAVWLVVIVFWALWLAWRRLVKIPKQRAAIKQRQEFFKYLPPSK